MAEQDALDAEQRLQAVRQQAEEGQTQSVQEVKRLLAEVEKGQQQAAEVHVLLQQAQDLGAIQVFSRALVVASGAAWEIRVRLRLCCVRRRHFGRPIAAVTHANTN
jgi:hypothetical protein